MEEKNTLEIMVTITKNGKGEEVVGHILLTPNSTEPESKVYQRNVRLLHDVARNWGNKIEATDTRTLRQFMQDLVNNLKGVAKGMGFDIDPDVEWCEMRLDEYNHIRPFDADPTGIHR